MRKLTTEALVSAKSFSNTIQCHLNMHLHLVRSPPNDFLSMIFLHSSAGNLQGAPGDSRVPERFVQRCVKQVPGTPLASCFHMVMCLAKHLPAVKQNTVPGQGCLALCHARRRSSTRAAPTLLMHSPSSTLCSSLQLVWSTVQTELGGVSKGA